MILERGDVDVDVVVEGGEEKSFDLSFIETKKPRVLGSGLNN